MRPPGQPGAVARKGDEVERRRVQEQLDPHEDADGVAPAHHGDEPERRQRRAQDQIVLEPDAHSTCTSFFPTTTAPMRTTRSSTEITSKGSRYCDRSRLPMGAEVGRTSRGAWGQSTAKIVAARAAKTTRPRTAARRRLKLIASAFRS